MNLSRFNKLVNVPAAADKIEVIGFAKQSKVIIQTDQGVKMVEVDLAHNSLYIAEHIARLIEEARDAGFEQGLAHVRKSLGM